MELTPEQLEQKIHNQKKALDGLYKKHYYITRVKNYRRDIKRGGGKISISGPISLEPTRPQVQRLEKQIEKKEAKIQSLEEQLQNVGR